MALPVWSKEEVDELMKFLEEKAKNAESPLCLAKVQAEYAQSGKTSRSWAAIKNRITRDLAHRVHTTEQFDTETKVRMLFALSIPVEPKFLEELKKNADVEVNKRGCIEKYRERKEGGLKLAGYAGRNSKSFTEEEDQRMLIYVARKAKEKNRPFPMHSLWKQYAVSGETTRAWYTIKKRFRCHLRWKIHQMKETPVDEHFLRELREAADVEVDEEGIIIKYRGDGLELVAELTGKRSVRRKRSLHEHLEMAMEQKRQRTDQFENVGLEEELEFGEPFRAVKEESADDFEEQPAVPNTPEEDLVATIMKEVTSFDLSHYIDELSNSCPLGSLDESRLGSVDESPLGSIDEIVRNMLQSQVETVESPAAQPNRSVSKKIVFSQFRNLIQEFEDPEMEETQQKLSDSIRKLNDGDEKLSAKAVNKIKSFFNELDDILD
ncbi:unnamed protein product [Caenorhabditis sp. 36 PRJEB53466]|nr:unnamed protein product [Caenorhabditis sp. 36 PRJEB53466]